MKQIVWGFKNGIQKLIRSYSSLVIHQNNSMHVFAQ